MGICSPEMAQDTSAPAHYTLVWGVGGGGVVSKSLSNFPSKKEKFIATLGKLFYELVLFILSTEHE